MPAEPPVLPPDLESRIAALDALAEPMRRALYLHVLKAADAVTRDQAAAAAGVSRGLAAFHLDRLADDGLLAVEYRRTNGRTGPGAGRPAKLYRPAAADHAVSLPPRAYELAAELLAEAVEATRPGGSGESAEKVAERLGRRAGERVLQGLGPNPSVDERLAAADAAMAVEGYQPYRDGDQTRLRSCPFHALMAAHGDLVCAMNEAFLRGLLGGLDVRDRDARPDPAPGGCCVLIAPA